MRIKLHLLLFSLLVSTWVHAQDDLASIDIVAFNSSINYGAGSGITVHFNPRGVFKFDDEEDAANDNQFFLELSPAAAPEVWSTIGTLDGFFATTMNGILPTNASGLYKLRVRASKGLTTITPEAYSAVFSSETSNFSISGVSALDAVVPFSNLATDGSNVFNCSFEGSFNNDALFGMLNLSSFSTSSELPTVPAPPQIIISEPNSSSTYNIRKIDVINNDIENLGTMTNPTDPDNPLYTIPTDIPIGTYNYEVQELDNNTGISSTYTIVLLLHRSSTTLANSSSETVCVNTEVFFNIDTSNTGIGENYKGSYYEIDFGDGSDPFIYTHAELLTNSQLVYVYNDVSCGFDENYFEITKKMFNKYNNNNDCIYQQTGIGVTKEVNISKEPQTSFQSSDICENTPITVVNFTIPGEFSNVDGEDCQGQANFYWEITSPSGQLYAPYIVNGTYFDDPNQWMTDLNSDGFGDLLIPVDDVEIGCWEFRLTSVNQDLCSTESTFPSRSEPPYVVEVQVEPQADFQFLNQANLDIDEICFGETVTFQDLSNVNDYNCQQTSYLWSILPNTGFSYITPFTEISQNPELVFDSPGIYEVTLTISNICGQSNIPKTITIFGDPTVNFATTSVAVCENNDERLADGYDLDFGAVGLAPVYSTIPYEPTSFIWTVSGGSGATSDYSFTSGTDPSSANPVIKFVEFGDYIIKVEVDGNCISGGNSAEFSFYYSETPFPPISDSVVPTICSGDSFNEIPTDGSGLVINATYTWTVEPNPSVTGQSNESAPQDSISQTLTNNSSVPQTVTYTVTPTEDVPNADCSGAPFQVEVTVNPTPVIPTQTDEICSGETFVISPTNSLPNTIIPSGTTYQWTVESNPSVTGQSNESSPQTQISQRLFNMTNAVQIVTYNVTPTSGAPVNCGGATFQVEVTVNPFSDIADVVVPAICSGTDFEVIPVNGGGSNGNDIVPSDMTYTWIVEDLSGQISGDSDESAAQNSISQTLTNDSNIPQTVTYTVIPIYDVATANCQAAPFQVEVTVNPTPVIPTQTDEICSGETFVISPTNSLPNTIIPSGTTYQWTVESNPSVTGQSNESSPQTQISQRLFNMTNAVQIVTYNVTPTSGADGFCIGDPFEVTVQVNPVPVIADVVVPAICSGTDFEVIPVNGGGSNSDDIVPSDMTYTWTVVDLSGQISGDSDESAAQNSISQTLTNDSNIPQTVTYTVIPTYDVAAANCQAAPFQVEVTVNPEPTMDAVASQSICGGTAFDALSYISDVSGVSYAWELTSTTIPTDITGYPFPSGTGELSPVVIQNDGDTPFTLNYELTVLYGGCEGNTVPFSITINPSPLVTISSSASQSICFGGTANFNTLTASYTYPEPITNVSYQWYYNTTDSTETTNAIPVGTDNQDYTPASNTIGTRYYFSVLSFNPNVCNDVASNTVEIVVNDPVIITVDPEPTQTICVGGEISGMSVAYSGGAGNPEYQWFEGTFPSGAPIPNSNFPDLELDPDYFSTVGTFDFYATISFPASSGCLSVTSASGSVIVVDDPVLTAPLATQSICQGSIPDLTVTASPSTSPTGVYTYQWYDALTNQPVVGATSDTFTLTMPSVGTFNYYAVVTTSTSGCETQSAPAEIIVEPAPSISTQPLAEQNLCQLETITDLEVLYANGIGTPTYQWYQSTTCDTTDLSTPVGTDAPIFSPPANIGAFYYFVELSFSEGGCGSIFSECSKVEITPLAFIPDLDPVVEIPDETSFIFSPQDGSVPDLSTIVPAGTTYTWTFVPNPNISGSNSFSEIDFPNGTGSPNAFDSGVLNNINPTFTQLETIVFQVTPWTNGCNGTPFDITITVAAAPEINEVITNQPCYYQDQLCEASIEISPVGFGPFTYNWVYLTDPSLPLPNPTDRDQFDLCSGFYQLTISDALNYSYQYEFEVVLPDPLLFNLVALTEISCNNTNTFPCDGSIEVSTSGGELPYSLVEWYTETIPDSGVFDSGPFVNNINPNELLNVCEGNYVLKILDANGCEYVSDIYTIAEAVDPIIITETLSDYNGFNIHCNAANSGTITIDLSGGSGVFDYTFVADATGTVLETDTIFNPPATLVFSALTAGDYTFTIEDPNCTDQIVRNFTLTQPNELIITATLVDAIDCFGGLATYDVIATGGVPPYTGTGLQNVPSGPVTFIVSDANDGFGGCQDDFSTIVFEPVELLATHNFNDALCFGDTGQITVTPTGGTGILTVNLYDNTNTFITSINTTQGSSVTFDQLAGTYFYDVVDQNNCPPYGPQVIVIDEPNPIDVIVTRADDPNCASSPEWEFNNGSICITIAGGTNPYPEPSFDLNGSPLNWVDNGGGEWCLNNLSLSPVDLDWEYPIVVTDDNGCLPAIPTVDVPLTRPSEISASFTYDPQIFDCPSNTVSQSVSVSISGGVPPYIVNWQGPEVNLDLTNQFVMTATASGNYMALVNDQHGIANGCPPIEFPLDPIIFYEFANAEFNYESGNNDFCGLFSISDPISFNIVSTGDIVNSEWDFGDGSTTVSNVESPTHVYDEIGTYIITLNVTDPYGCIDSYSYPIEITKGYEIVLPTAFTPNADGINDNIRPVYNCMTQVEMIIYDTWGSLLYTETGENIIGWDGTIEGSPAENGNYIMVVRAQAFNGVVVDLNGPITLLK